MKSLTFSLALSFLLSTTSALAKSDMVPMPACLTTCFRTQARGSVSNTHTCTPNFVTDVRACIPGTCAPKDQTYVQAYFNSYCTAYNTPNATVSVTMPFVLSSSSLVTSFGTGTAPSTAYPTAGASSGMEGAVLKGNGTVVSPSPSPTAAVFQGAAATSGGVGWWFGIGVVGAVILLAL